MFCKATRRLLDVFAFLSFSFAFLFLFKNLSPQTKDRVLLGFMAKVSQSGREATVTVRAPAPGCAPLMAKCLAGLISEE